ncbi:MAG: tandem-95 repeat protein [Shewanella sp.]|nr:tandem-95 repeat protein [Shewanella sp.]
MAPVFGNNLNLVLEDTWGDKNYGVMLAESDYIFVASDGVIVLDATTPNEVFKVTKISLSTPERIIRIKKQDNYLYAMTEKELFIVNVENINSPEVVSTLVYSGSNHFIDFTVSGTALYTLGMDGNHLSIYDLTSISKPVLSHSKSFGNTVTNRLALALTSKGLVVVAEDMLYLISLESETVFDVLYSAQQTINYSYSSIPTSDNTVYFNHENNIIRYDFSDLGNVVLSLVSLPDDPGQVYVRDMVIAGTRLSVLQSHGTVSEHELNSTMNQVDSYYIDSPNTYHLAVTDNAQAFSHSSSVYIASRGINQSEYNFSGVSKAIDIKDGLLAYADETLKLFDISSGKFSKIVESDSGYFTSVGFIGGLLYSSHNEIYDTSAADKLTVVGGFGPYNSSAEKILQDGDNLYYLTSTEIFSYDNSNPLAPIGNYSFTIADLGNSDVYNFENMSVVDGHLFVGTNYGLYHLYDDGSGISNSGLIGDPENISSTQLVGSYLYQTYYAGLNIWDISNISAPTLTKTLSDFLNGELDFSNQGNVELAGDRLFIQYDKHFIAFDVIDPANPVLVESIISSEIGYAADMKIDNSSLWIARKGQLKKFQLNAAPKIETSHLSVNEDSNLSTVLEVSNEPGDELAFEVLTQPSLGNLSIDDAGEVNYVPNLNEFGEDSFVVRVIDNYQGDDQKEIMISILAINDRPTVEAQVGIGNEDEQINGSLFANDVEEDELSYILLEQSTSGVVSLNDSGEYTYIPSLNFNGTDQFSFTVTDGSSEPVQANVTLTIEPVNDNPTLSVSPLELQEDHNTEVQLMAEDIDGDTLIYSLVSNAVNGNVTVSSSGAVVYTPDSNFEGSDSFTVSVSDGAVSTAVQVLITVTPVNDAPKVESQSMNASHNGTVSGSLKASDIDGDTLTYEVITDVSNGVLTLNGDGTFNYSPNNGFSGSDSFTYRATDTSDESVESTVSFLVASKPKESSGSGGGSMGGMVILFLLLVLSYRRGSNFR